MYERFEHTADLGLRVRATDLDSLFAEAARGLFSVIVDDLERVQPTHQWEIQQKKEIAEDQLFDWLNELLFRFETQHLLFCKFAVHLTNKGLDAVAWGEELDESRHSLNHEVKAITYHGLKVKEESDGWLAEVIVDI